MQKNQRCKDCGGVYTFHIPDSTFQREACFILYYPYCKKAIKMMIEDGWLILEVFASFSVTNLRSKKAFSKVWLELITDKD